MKQYHDFLRHILKYGNVKGDRTGTGTISAIVPPQMRFDLRDGFPIVTSKEVNFETIKRELKWFTNGDTNIKYLLDHGVNIWNGDAHRWYQEKGGELSRKEFIEKIKTDPVFARIHGDLGPIYGKQWRAWDKDNYPYTIDQLANVVEQIKEAMRGNHTHARRLIVSAWNAGDLDEMGLPPCHVFMQFFVTGNGLSLHMYQRSGDAFLGIPFNISSYALLLTIIASEVGLFPEEFIHTVGDAHIYLNHTDQVTEQLLRTEYPLPDLAISKRSFNIDTWESEDFTLVNYQHHPAIKGDLSV